MTNPMNRISWISVIALLGWIMCGLYAFGYSCGQKYELKKLQAPIITEYGPKRYDPNKDSKYKSLIEQGYKWIDGRWWPEELLND